MGFRRRAIDYWIEVKTQVAGARPSFSSREIGSIDKLLSPLGEQRAIAVILSDMDAGIAALERCLDKTSAIKQGMMQALLTGRVGLVQPEVWASEQEAETMKTDQGSVWLKT